MVLSFDQVQSEEAVLSEIYIGRLASLNVSIQNLKERFSAYGDISYVRLFNRGIVGLDAPVDAFAYVGFKEEAAAQCAIAAEDGSAWLGQVITVQPLDPDRAMSI